MRQANRMRLWLGWAALPIAAASLGAAPPPGGFETQRALRVEDYFALQEVGDPRVSPDGAWVAFTVETRDLAKDRRESRIWMVPTSGGEAIPMTAVGSSARRPRWSPDGKYLSFLSDRKSPDTPEAEEDAEQVWALDRRGGDASPLTQVKQGVGGYEWSPDGRRLVLLIRDPKPEKGESKEGGEGVAARKPPAPEPWVIDRLQFKRDGEGYLDRRRAHLHLFDLDSRLPMKVTSGDYEDSEPAWSPDGRLIAFVSNRTQEPDANYNTDLWLVGADSTDAGAPPTRLTTNPGSDQGPIWHPDGQRLVYISITEPAHVDYAQTELAVIGVGGGEPRLLTEGLDRNVSEPRFSPDGATVFFELEDSGEVHLASIPVAGGAIQRPISGRRRVAASAVAPDGRIVALISEPNMPQNLFCLDPGSGNATLRQLTHVNDQLLAGIRLAEPEEIRFSSPDGTPVEAFVYPPVFAEGGRPYPTLLWIHGGPMMQYDYGFDFEAQLLAASGYLVVMPNPRGSTGYGVDFTLAIWRDWGNRDRQDVLAAVDYLVQRGDADPDRLGVAGWSYGGILTNYVITGTDRFKAAISGASGGLWAANYGHDHYQHWWETEFGLPWEEREIWERLSPFNKVQSIVTPTLWIGGKEDWNVPIQNSEQMYQAMKRLGRETLLVVYPGESHVIERPSYVKDMYQRFLGWLDGHLKAQASR